MVCPSGDSASDDPVPIARGARSDAWIAKRVTPRAGAGGERIQATTAAAAAPATAAAASRHHPRAGLAATIGAASAVPASASSSRASPMCCSRCFGSFSRQRRSSRRIDGGVPTGSAVQAGSARSTAASVSATSSPLNSRWPVSIS